MGTTMKERPIIFSGSMVRAILDGRKTQTRRIIPARVLDKWTGYEHHVIDLVNACGYGVPGDRLWVRETLRTGAKGNHEPAKNHVWRYDADNCPIYVNEASVSQMIVWAHHEESDVCPSIHMPRWASRITLEITEVRVQRVQEISEADAKAEGLDFMEPNRFAPPGGRDWMSHDAAFHSLWDAVNGPGAWERNDWVWAITFKRV